MSLKGINIVLSAKEQFDDESILVCRSLEELLHELDNYYYM